MRAISPHGPFWWFEAATILLATRSNRDARAIASLADLHVGHALGVEMTAIGFELHIARADGLDVRVDSDAAEDEISAPMISTCSGLAVPVGDSSRSRNLRCRYGWGRDACRRDIARAGDVERQAACDRAELGIARSGDVGMHALRRSDRDLPRSADFKNEGSAHLGDIELARSAERNIGAGDAARFGLGRGRFEMEYALVSPIVASPTRSFTSTLAPLGTVT